jgi:glycosyltransferase involved in cell wall biosynthesis
LIVAVIPVYNEASTISRVVEETKKYVDLVVVVDDGSTDGTRKVLKNLNGKVFVHTHIVNRGVGAATATGITAALNSGADIIVTLDADLQHKPRDIPRLIEPIVRGEADVVIGSRFKKPPQGMPFTKIIGNKLLNFITKVLYGFESTDTQSGFKAFSRKAASKIEITVDKYGFCSEIIGEIKKNNLKMKEVPIDVIYLDKQKGTSIIDGIGIAVDLILKRFSR